MSKREIYRILDASANRGREAIRVVEDVARFLGDSQELASTLKETRHRFAAAANKLDRRERMRARDTLGDVGTNLEGSGEYQRASLLDVLIADFARLEESARSLEEFCKIVQPELAREWEQIRYAAYTLEKIAYQRASELGLDLVDDADDADDDVEAEKTTSQADADDPVASVVVKETSHDDEATATPTAASELDEPSAEPYVDEEEEDDVDDEEAETEDHDDHVEEPAAPESTPEPRPTESSTPSTFPSDLGAIRRQKLAGASLCAYVNRDLTARELLELLRSEVDAVEMSFHYTREQERIEATENFLRQWFTVFPDAVENLENRPLLFSRDTSLWGDALDGWVVPLENVVDARRVVGRQALVGVVVSSLEDAYAAIQAWQSGYVDFIEVGPVFVPQEGIPATTPQLLHAIVSLFDNEPPIPIFAFGGVNTENCGAIFDSGIERVGVGDAILNPPNKRVAVDSFRELF